MPPLPFIGRLHPIEYLALVLSFTLAFAEGFIRTITLLLPRPVIQSLYRASRAAFNALSSPYSRRARNRKRSVSSPIAHASDFVELCELYGYYAEEHVVQTKDGFLLGVHRLGWRQGEEDQPVNGGPGTLQKKVVYFHHGLMMNSEVWVCLTEKERCLPFALVDRGYDVWLGNNRGNKYSKKSMHHKPTSNEFWDFSMDEFAFFDIPDSIDYILTTTHQPSLSYVGFSQGTAQAFATLSIHPTLNSKIDVFVALAPAMSPPGLNNGVVSSLCKSNPEVLFLLFGRRAILSSATMWSALLYPAIFTWFIDKSLDFLFNWRMRNILPSQKLAAYPHLYSFTGTKSVVHWFQIIRNGTFQMYDDEVSTPLSLSSGSKYYKVAKFPTRNIKTPIVLVYGGSDSLVDIQVMLKELPKHTVAKAIPKYEHLDFLWAADVDKLVFPHVLEALESYAQPPFSPAQAIKTPAHRKTLQDIEPTSPLPATIARIAPSNTNANIFDADDRPSTAEEQEQMDESSNDEDFSGDTPERLALTPAEYRQTHSPSTTLSPSRRSGRLSSKHTARRPSASVASDRTVISSAPVDGTQRRRIRSPTDEAVRRRREDGMRNSVSRSSEDGTLVPRGEDVDADGVGTGGARPEGWWSSTSSSREELRG